MKELYDNFLSDFEHRINPLALMEIAMYCLLDISGRLDKNLAVSVEVVVGTRDAINHTGFPPNANWF